LFLHAPPTPHLSPLPLHAALPIPHPGSALPGSALHGSTQPGSTQPGRDLIARVDNVTKSYGTAENNVLALRDVSIGLERGRFTRSEEHTSELQSLTNLVCRLLLEK